MQCQYRSLVWVQLNRSELKDLATLQLEKKWSWVDTRQVDQGPTGLGVYWWQGQPSSSIVAREALVHTPESEEVRFYFMSCRIVEWCELDGEIVSAWPGNYFRLQRSPPTQPKRILAFRHPRHLSRSPLFAIYKGIDALYWPSIINYQLLPPHNVLYWPSTQLHHLVTHSWANWI